ncbi:MAG: putative toxin-antitoxin system toxin component, PIN family [Bacteroidetes bacterium]|nr:putative toxin-antitoxin system toxin component, PIN family [Bacteroidota bacterium]MBU1719156.1 putative toxin-antitoxin system toxin component, PIN family [Bacteroidota bacterium]
MVRRKRIRIVLDTNIWISFLIGKRLSILSDLILADKVQVLFSEQIVEEITMVTKRPKIRKYFQEEKTIEFLAFLDIIGEKIEISTEVNQCRDPKDNFLISLAIDGKANYLITGDDDLLELKKIGRIKIVNFSQFEEGVK